MSILGRIAGFAVVGPIGLVGPTEASKRSKRQLAELQKQTELLEAARASVGQTTTQVSLPWEYKHLLKRETAPHPFSPNPVHEKYSHFCSQCGGPPEDHIPGSSLWSREHNDSLALGDGVILVTDYDRKGVTVTAGTVGEITRGFEKWKGFGVTWDGGAETVKTPACDLVLLEAVQTAAAEMAEAEAAEATKACPDCAETIKAAARKCRFCGYMFEAPTKLPQAPE